MHCDRLSPMTGWMRRIRGALGMGFTWALAWAIGGLMIGVLSFVLPLDWFFRVFDAPLPALAIPGFFAGAFFSVVLGIAARKRRFSELSMPRFVAWGALGGVMLSLFPVLLVRAGLGTPAECFWPALGIAAGPFILLSAGSAAATLAIARKAERGTTLPRADSEGQNRLDAPAGQPLPSFQKLQDREKA